MKKSCFVLLLLCFITAKVNATNTLKICYENWQPYAYLNKDGFFKGSVIEKLLKSSKKHHIQLQLYETPHLRCVNGVKKGVFDIALFVDKYGSLNLLPNKIANWQLALVTRKSISLKNYRDYTKSKIKTVLIAREYEYPTEMLQRLHLANKEIIKMSYYTNNEMDKYGLFSLIAKDKIDAMLVDKAWAKGVIQALQLNIKINPWLFHNEPQYAGYATLSNTKLSQISILLEDLQ